MYSLNPLSFLLLSAASSQLLVRAWAFSSVSRLCWRGPQYLLTVSLFLISTLLPGVALHLSPSRRLYHTPPPVHHYQTCTRVCRRRTENSVNPQASSCISPLDVPKLFQSPCARCQKSSLTSTSLAERFHLPPASLCVLVHVFNNHTPTFTRTISVRHE